MPPSRDLPRCRARRGFTLVELLVVIGIIAVLAGLLLTVRSRATDQAAGVTCLNNLRQLGAAMNQYAQENDQAYPFASPLDPPGDRKEDWVHWHITAGQNLATDVNGSAIARYTGAKGEGLVALLRCPADDPSMHRHIARSGSAIAYPFSYAMNYFMSSEQTPQGHQYMGGKTANKGATPRVTAINRPSEKILLVEENERTIDDGMWQAGEYTDILGARRAWRVRSNYLSVRHETHKAEYRQPVDMVLPDQTLRGNAVFVDGHAEWIPRRMAHDPRHLLPNNEGTPAPWPPPAQ